MEVDVFNSNGSLTRLFLNSAFILTQVNGSGAQNGGVQSLSSFRYAPYPVPSAMAANQAAVHQAQAAALMAQHHHHQQQQQHHHQQQQQQSQGQPTQHSVGSNPAHSLATTLSLASNPSIPTMAQAAHLTAVLPTVSIGGGGSLASPSVAATAGQLAAAAAAAANHAATGAPNPYQGYNLANVDMSSFQGIDWSSMYGMGMYV